MSAPKLEYITRCRIPGCSKEFVSDPFTVPIIGQPDKRIFEFIGGLMKHLEKKHPQEFALLQATIQRFMGFAVVSLAEISDPTLIAAQEQIRHGLHQATARLTITDEHIASRLAALELEPEDEEGITDLIKDMRDLLTESGRYAPAPAADKPLVTAV